MRYFLVDNIIEVLFLTISIGDKDCLRPWDTEVLTRQMENDQSDFFIQKLKASSNIESFYW